MNVDWAGSGCWGVLYNLDKINWVYAVNTPRWEYGIFFARTRSALGGTFIRLFAAVMFPKNPLFHSVQTDWRYTDSGPPEPKIIYSTSPGPALPTDATPRTRSVLGGPSPRRGNASGFRRTFEAQGLGAHVARRARTAPPRRRSTPLTGARSFVSRRHKSAEIRYLVPGSSVGNSS